VSPSARERTLADRIATALVVALHAALTPLALDACGSPLVGAECEPDGCNPPACVADPDCPRGMLCVGGACVAPKPECTSNKDCKAAEVCLHGRCQAFGDCTDDAHCPCDKGTCSAGKCVAPAKTCDSPPTACKINADCPTKMVCVGAVCTYTTECLSHADCPLDQACFGTLCYAM
jgi:hypothetical protein